eukprot:scaffold17718_cov109-Isochrysis_galbana.AAC.1
MCFRLWPTGRQGYSTSPSRNPYLEANPMRGSSPATDPIPPAVGVKADTHRVRREGGQCRGQRIELERAPSWAAARPACEPQPASS